MGANTGISIADMTNIFVMMIVLICFFIMLMLLLRNMAIVGVVGEGDIMGRMPWANMAAPRPPRLLMQRVHIPFTFKLIDPGAISYSEVLCGVSSRVRYVRACWWGAPVRELHAALCAPLQRTLYTDHLTRHCNHHTPLVRSGCHGERNVSLGLDAPLVLGAPPRACYPLVVLLARYQEDTHHLRPDDTVALVSVVHIRDDSCPLPSTILAQYLKQANGQLSCLKRLYVSGEMGCEEDNTYAAQDGGALCCVCAAQTLSRALLPCRHACLCASCFPKVDKCPICRSGIESYFCIRAEEERCEEVPAPRKHRWLLTWNDRLIDFLGYH